MKRNELKKYVTSKIKEGIKNYIFNLPTGYGKSSLSLHIINKLGLNKPKVLLLIAEKAHKSNWEKEINKFLKISIDLRVECYQSMHKLKNLSFDFLIADEAHHLNTELRKSLFKFIKSEYKIFLSATYNNAFKDYLLKLPNSFEFSINLQTAIDNSTLPTPRILVLASEPTNSERTYTIMIKKEGSPIICTYPKWIKTSYSNRNKSFIVYCTFKEYCLYFKNLRNFYYAKWKVTKSKRFLEGYSRTIIKEKRFLGEAKTNILKAYADKFRKEGKRFIFFTSSIKQAEEIGNALTSKTKNPVEIIESFNKKKTNELIAVNMLQEGQNLVDTEIGFICQVDSSSRSIIQKIGRLLRHPNPTILIHYFKDTIEEDYTIKAIKENFNSDYVEYKELKLK